MLVSLCQVDAFAARPFDGNPAAVVPLDAWLGDSLLQAIAQENNLSETAFYVPWAGDDADYELRWMTPAAEVALCGHATLATAHVLWNELGCELDAIRFRSRSSGVLTVTRGDNGLITLDFPTIPIERIDPPEGLGEALGIMPDEVYKSYDLICVYEHKRHIHELKPDFPALAKIQGVRAIGVTAPGAGHDFVARLFAPAVGINEDPVTGSLYTMLGPYWSERLGKRRLTAHQVAKRGGELWLHLPEDRPGRIEIAGHAVTYLRGEISLPE
ncbi:MAG: PhzF family phenazine biosynthesis protein [Planctomycetota bacterium]